MKVALAIVVSTGLLAAVPAARQSHTFVGTISDEMCGLSHDGMRMGPTDAECTLACHDEHGSALVLVDDEHVYLLSDQDAPKALAGKRVKVMGTLDPDGRTIKVASIAPE